MVAIDGFRLAFHGPRHQADRGLAAAMTDGVSAPRDGIEAAIVGVYQDVLRRQPSAGEQAEWSAKLLRGVPIRVMRTALESEIGAPPVEGNRPDVRGIEATSLFDTAWYASRYPDIAQAGMNPIEHYAAHGWREDRAPNPWFDPVWYRATYDIPPHEQPLPHYASAGEASGFRPCANFDPVWYRANYNLRANQPALADFLRRRFSRTVAPCAALWPALGLPEPHLTAVADDVFLSVGDGSAAELILRDAGVFDENYYALHSGDVLSSGQDMLTHYCAFGWTENRQPNFYFDANWYAATNPEVTRLAVNPLVHYLLAGEPEGRRPIVFFDPVWYAKANELTDDISPLAHFLAHRREGLVAPNEFFDPAWYAQRKGEQIRAGRDPFARFLVAGLTEDISPSARFDLAAWRRRSIGRVSRNFRHLMDPARDNPLVHYLLSTYR